MELDKPFYLPVRLTKDLEPDIVSTACLNTEMYIGYNELAIFEQYFRETIIDCFAEDNVELLIPLAKYLFETYVK